MSYGLYMSAAGAYSQKQKLEVIANNLANVDTPGFKSQLAVLQARSAEAVEQGLVSPGLGKIEDQGGGLFVRETVTNFAEGKLKQTGIGSDLAIDGEGFFVVNKDGEQLLTRAGNFAFRSDGTLTASDGSPVLSVDSTEIRIDPSRPWKFQDNGVLTQGGEGIPLAMVRPESMADLEHAGGNYFLAPGEVTATASRKVRPNFLEMSGVNPTSTMMGMIEATRAYEANVRMIQSQDEITGSLLSRVLRA
jgi:flagellar basal-body rod protein FlgF